jgi:hypothetical protein
MFGAGQQSNEILANLQQLYDTYVSDLISKFLTALSN